MAIPYANAGETALVDGEEKVAVRGLLPCVNLFANAPRTGRCSRLEPVVAGATSAVMAAVDADRNGRSLAMGRRFSRDRVVHPSVHPAQLDSAAPQVAAPLVRYRQFSVQLSWDEAASTNRSKRARVAA